MLSLLQSARRRKVTRTGLVISVLLTLAAIWGTQADPDIFRDLQLKYGRSETAGVKVVSFAKTAVPAKTSDRDRPGLAVSYRVNYQFKDQSGWEWNAEEIVDDRMFSTLAGKDTARVQYLKSNPRVCRLVK